jgi:hypothetical protein
VTRTPNVWLNGLLPNQKRGADNEKDRANIVPFVESRSR